MPFDMNQAAAGGAIGHKSLDSRARGGVSGVGGTQMEAYDHKQTMGSLQEQYTRPSTFSEATPRNQEAAARLNTRPALPAKYQLDDAEKEHMALRESVNEVMETVNPARVPKIGEFEYNYIAKQKALRDLEAKDAYVNTLFDSRVPGSLEHVMKIQPEFVQRRLQQMADDFDGAYRAQAIDFLGVQDKADFDFQYARDQGLIDVPGLYFLEGPGTADGSSYVAGRWSPFDPTYKNKTFGQRDNLPFSNVQYGPRNQGTVGVSRNPAENGLGGLIRNSLGLDAGGEERVGTGLAGERSPALRRAGGDQAAAARIPQYRAGIAGFN